MNILTKELMYEPNFTIALIGCIVSVSIIIITGIYGFIHSKHMYKIIVTWLITFGIYLTVICLCCTVFSVPTGKYEYTATIDDTVSLAEFHEQYEFISYEDGIFTFKDK